MLYCTKKKFHTNDELSFVLDWKSLVEYIWLFISLLKSPNIMKLSVLKDSISTINSSVKELMVESGGRYTTIHLIDLELWLCNEKVTNSALGDIYIWLLELIVKWDLYIIPIPTALESRGKLKYV